MQRAVRPLTGTLTWRRPAETPHPYRQELISNGKKRVYFWSWSPSATRFQYYSPPLRSRDFKQKKVADFVSSVFVPGTTQALTATEDGDLLVWDEQGITAQVGTGVEGGRGGSLGCRRHVGL